METIDYSLMTKTEAIEQIAAIDADPGHPFHSPPSTAGKERRLAVEHYHQLHLVKHGELNPEPLDSATAVTTEAFLQAKRAESFGPKEVKAMEEGIALKENRDIEVQAARLKQANSDMDRYVSAGGVREPVPDDISAYEVNVGTMRTLMVEDDYASLMPMINRNLNDLSAPPAIRQMTETIVGCRDDLSLKEIKRRNTSTLIAWILQTRDEMK